SILVIARRPQAAEAISAPCTWGRDRFASLAMTEELAFPGRLPRKRQADIDNPPLQGIRARSSAGEHYLDMVGVTGSIPVAPTSLRLLRKLRLGQPKTVVAKQAKAAAPKPAGRRRASAARELRLGKPAQDCRGEASEGCRAEARRAEAGVRCARAT